MKLKISSKGLWKNAAGAVGMVLIALCVGGVLVAVSGNSPMEAYGSMLSGALSTPQRVSELFVKMIPLAIMSFGVSIAYKAHLWNIGAEGQFTMAAIASTAVALYVPLPAWLLLPLTFVVAGAAGGLWAGLAGWLKVRFGANEVITTLMLNYIAKYFLAYLVYGPMMDPGGELAQSRMIADALKLPQLFANYRLHAGLFLMLLLFGLMILLWRSTPGYRIDLVGKGEKVATYAGVNVRRTMVLTMALSGALAGMAGWSEIFGLHYRILEGFTGGYGDIATVIALLGGLNPVGILASSGFFSVLLVGGSSMQRMTDVPYSIVDVIQGLIIIFVIARAALGNVSWKKGGRKHAK